ncbi:hypothetical protein KY284_020605 [Solanum tuberosum]|nr:hypothetical protein KY284_020605 [Solanum tuberosum]
MSEDKSAMTGIVPALSKITDPPTGETKMVWLRDDAKLLLQIINFIDNEVVGLVNHFCKAFYHSEKKVKSLTAYFMEFKKTYEELNVILLSSTDIKEGILHIKYSIKSANTVLVAKGGGRRTNAARWNNKHDAGRWNNNNDAEKWNHNSDAGKWNHNNDVGK